MGTTANKLGRTFLSGALAVTLALPVVGVQKAEAAAGFPDWDVQTNAWYVPYIEWAVENDVVSGYPDGTFAPDQNVTRGQLAIMLARAVGVDVDDTTVHNATPFTDNLNFQYYTAAVNWAYENGILTGFEGKVRPDDSVTRQEAAAMLGRFTESVLVLDTSTSGMDWPVGTNGQEGVQGYALEDWLWLANKGVLQGNDNGDGTFTLNPEGTFTRAQTAKVVTVLIRDVLPTIGEIEHKTPARIEFKDVTSTGFTAVAYDKHGRDISDRCEFSVDPYGYWQRSPVFTGLQADTWYTVYARMSATATELATGAYATGIKTAEASEPQPGDEQGTVEVVEYKLVSRSYTQMFGLETETPYGKGIISYTDDFVNDPPEVIAAEQELQDYGKMMFDLNTAPTDKCDTVTMSIIRHDYYLMRVGSHTETYRNAEEKAKLYAHGTSCIPAEKLRVTGGDYRDDIEYTMADGKIIKGKHAAWEYMAQTGYKPVDVSASTTPTYNGPYDAKTPAQMIRDAGGDPNQPWCLDSDGMILG